MKRKASQHTALSSPRQRKHQHSVLSTSRWIDISVPLRSGMVQWPDNPPVRFERVIEIHDSASIKPEELHPHRIRRGQRLLFKTRNSQRCWRGDSFIEDFVYISKEAAHFLAERGVRTVGVDYLSVGGFRCDGVETHRVLLEAGIWIIEGLDLSQVEAGEYELICLPLMVEGGDGAPARAILRLARGVGERGTR